MRSSGWRAIPWVVPRLSTALVVAFVVIYFGVRAWLFPPVSLLGLLAVGGTVGSLLALLAGGFELQTLRAVEISTDGVTFVYPLRAIPARWSEIRPESDRPFLNMFDFRLTFDDGPRRNRITGTTVEQARGIVAHPSHPEAWDRMPSIAALRASAVV